MKIHDWTAPGCAVRYEIRADYNLEVRPGVDAEPPSADACRESDGAAA